MKASDLFLKCLEEEGVDTIFGVPGEENADIMMSLLDSPIEFISCKHEQGAAFMADIYGKLTGRPGVCLATLGPGATNLVTGVASANMDRSPLIAITGQAGTGRLHKESHQNMDSISMFKPITKWTQAIYDPDNIPEVVRKAFKLATTEKPGACMIELPENIAKLKTENRPFRRGLKVRRPSPDYKAVDIALDLMKNAKCPVILAGNGCVRTRAAKQLNNFVAKTGYYVAHTFMGKGAISDRNPQSLYTAGLSVADYVTDAFKEADLVLAIGYDMVEWHPSFWNQGNEKKIIHIDFIPGEVDENYRTDVELIGDIAGALWELNQKIGQDQRREFPEFAALRVKMCEDINAKKDSTDYPMSPQKIIYDVREALGDDDILISDVGAHKIWIARQYPTYQPSSCIITNGFCSMGIALPGAIAAKKLFPQKKVLAISGDGGFMMNIQELSTAVRYKIPAVFLVLVDGYFGLIKWKQEANYGKSSNVDVSSPDFVKLAEAFGCGAIRVEAADQLRPALDRAFADGDRPTVITVEVDNAANMELTNRFGCLVCR